MKLKELYKKVRRKQEISLDEDAMWEAIESRLEQPKKKRRFLWIWLSIGALLTVTYFYLKTELRSTIKVNKAVVSNSQSPPIPENEAPIMTPRKSESKSLGSNLIDESSPSVAQTLDSKISASSSYTSSGTDVLEKVNLSNQKRSTAIRNEQKNDNPIKLYTTTANSKKSSNQQVSIDELLSSRPFINLYPLPMHRLTAIEIKNKNFELDAFLLQEIVNESENSLKKNSESRAWKLEFSESIAYINAKNTIVEKDPMKDTWAKLHERSKSPFSSYQVNSVLKLKHTSGLSVGSGIILRLVSEWYDTTIEEVNPIEVESDSASFAFVEGIPQFTSGLLKGTETFRTNYHTPVRRLYFDIPLEFSYCREFRNFNFEALLSYNFNLSHQYYGRSYADAEKFLDRNQLKSEAVYKNRFVNSTILGLNISRNLTPYLSAGLSLNYWHQLSSSLNANSSIEEYYRGYGVGMIIKRNLIE